MDFTKSFSNVDKKRGREPARMPCVLRHRQTPSHDMTGAVTPKKMSEDLNFLIALVGIKTGDFKNETIRLGAVDLVL